MRHEYVYLAHTYRGHRPTNRVKIEEYENGIIFGVPLFTTMHMDMMRLMRSSITFARADATKQNAGRRLSSTHVSTGTLKAVRLDEAGMGVISMDDIHVDPASAGLFKEPGTLEPLGPIDSLSFADPRGVSATVTITDPEFIDILSGGTMRHVSIGGLDHTDECMKLPSNECCCPPRLAVVPEESGIKLPAEHRSGCSYSRTGRCICGYIGQWDDK
jgi:hypothetical protein